MAFRFVLIALIVSLTAAFVPQRVPLQLQRSASSERAAAPCCAYNPQPSKARPKKTKGPKEKVKAAAPTAAIAPEQTFWEGAPSITETFIPGLSLFTVVGVIPFSASLARQAWTKYKFTSRRIEVASGFQGKDLVQVLWRECVDVKWLRRFGGAAGDIVVSLQDGSKLEMRSVPEFDRNLAFIMQQVDDDARDASNYPVRARMRPWRLRDCSATPAHVRCGCVYLCVLRTWLHGITSRKCRVERSRAPSCRRSMRRPRPSKCPPVVACLRMDRPMIFYRRTTIFL